MGNARALFAGPGAARALRAGGSGRLEIALGCGGYVRLGDEWVLLTTPRAVPGPLSLLVAGLGAAPAQPGWAAEVTEDALVVGPVRVALAGMRTLRPDARVRTAPEVLVRRAMAAALASAPRPPAALDAGLRALRAGRTDAAINLLAGRGDGLTPAGDDVLAGYAGCAAALRSPARLSARAAPRASPLGLAYLRCAERGELAAPAAALLAAVLAGDAPAAARRARVLCRWGSSSGSALLWGAAAKLGVGALPAHPTGRYASTAPSGSTQSSGGSILASMSACSRSR